MVLFKITLLFKRIRVIDVVTARARTERKAIMKTFTIDENNNITVFGGKEEAAGTSGLVFSSQKELAKLTAEWPVSRFLEIWNGFAGVAPFSELKPVKKFTDRNVAVARIWQAIQRLSANGAASVPEPEGRRALLPSQPQLASGFSSWPARQSRGGLFCVWGRGDDPSRIWERLHGHDIEWDGS
jgi:hypothetical protein